VWTFGFGRQLTLAPAYAGAHAYVAIEGDQLIALDCGSLLFAEYHGQRLATALIIDHGEMASYKYGGSTQEHRSVMAPYLLHFEAMRAAKSRSCGKRE